MEHSFKNRLSGGDFDTGVLYFELPIPFSARATQNADSIAITVRFTRAESPNIILLMKDFWSHKHPEDPQGKDEVHRVLVESSRDLQNLFSFFIRLVFDYCGCLTPPFYTGELPLRMSADGDNWYGYPPQCVIAPRLAVLGRIDAEGLTKYVRWHVERNEPPQIGLYLLSQAQSLLPANPRGALVIAVTGLEVGVKSIIGHIAPLTEWLLDEMPAPPVLKLLTEFAPKLVSLNPTPPPTLRAKLRDAVEKRNRLVHRNEPDPTPQEASDVIHAIKNALGILQRSRGLESGWRLVDHDVRRDYLLEECRNEIKAGPSLSEKAKSQILNAINDAVSPKTSNHKKAAAILYGQRQDLSDDFLKKLLPLTTGKFRTAWDEIGDEPSVNA